MPHAWGYASDKRDREENQDNFGLFEVPLGLLAVVCDGMGGHVGGAVASALAVREIHAHMSEASGDPQRALQEAIERANGAVYDRSRKSRRLMGMGTTVVAALITDKGLIVAHVGDSRAYFTRGGEADTITRDHTMVNLFVDAELLSPEDAASHPEAHVLARSLGVERSVEVDVQDPLPFEAGDAVILCSDGVHGFIDDAEFGTQDWRNPQDGIEHLFKLLRERDSDDNATMIAVSADGNDAVVTLPLTEVPEVPEDDDADGGRLASVPSSRPSNPTIAPIDYDEPQEPSAPKPPPMATPEPKIQYEEIGAPPPMNIEIGVNDGATGGSTSGAHPLAPEPPGPSPAGAYTIGADPDAPVAQEKKEDDRDLSKAKPVGGGRRTVVLVGAAVLLLGAGVVGAGGLYMLTQGSGQTEREAAITVETPSPDAQPAPAQPDTAPPTPEPTDAVEPAPDGTEPVPTEPAPEPAATDAAPEPEPEPEQLEFPEDVEDGVAWLADPVDWAPEYEADHPGFEVRAVPPPDEAGGFYIHAQKPDMGRTGMHRAEKYVNVPPGGSTQITVVKLAREAKCGEAMDKLSTAMKTSIDYASLYSQVWSCYNLGHQKKLYGVAITDMDEYAEQLWHFEGEDRRGSWYGAADNGIDHRLEQWMAAEGENSFAIIMLDLIGAEKAARDLAADMLLEAEAAAAFGRLTRHNTRETGYWARRVYITALAFSGSPGDLVEEHQPEAHARIQELLNEATRGGLDNPTGVRLPSPVKSALLGGLGERPVRVATRPDPKPAKAEPKPQPKPEPEDLRPVIYSGPPKR